MSFSIVPSDLSRQFHPLDWRSGRARGIALFLGGFSLLNLLGEIRWTGFDANLWWIDLRLLSVWPSRIVLGLTGVVLVHYGIQPRLGVWRRRVTMGTLWLLGLVALANATVFYWLLFRGAIQAGLPLPFSLLVAGALGLVWRGLIEPAPTRPKPSSALPAAIAFLASFFLFPLAQEFCFGKTDYRRRADAVVVFGARAYADGRPSDALADRVRTGCRLYREGLARKLIFSGGPGDGQIHETEAMRRMALGLGVPDGDILLDPSGWNTRATVRNTVDLFERHGIRRALAVSHFYHLPRIKLSYRRAGVEISTVPAAESYFLRQTPVSILREIPALWVYYLRPLV